jgi:Rps23 Pro-64 3,4-dihydroxylase Tpa1-like proline 4-hydroxylase
MIDFDYKIYNMCDVLTKNEYSEVESLVEDFIIDLNTIKTTLGFLQWSDKIQNGMIKNHPEDYKRIVGDNLYGYDDFKKLVVLNENIGLDDSDYFNFLLTYRNEEIINSRLFTLYDKAYKTILKDVFGKNVRTELPILFGHFNVYPKGSFIRKHDDGPKGCCRYFTTLFFVNKGRKYEDGSLLKIYKESDVIEIVPDFNRIVLLDHMNYNYVHEVSKNLIDDVRYSLYTPFNFDDYDKLLI